MLDVSGGFGSVSALEFGDFEFALGKWAQAALIITTLSATARPHLRKL